MLETSEGPTIRSSSEVLVRSEYSLVSTGTERTAFLRLFESGTHWDAWVRYPFYPGYATVGVVVDLGRRAKLFEKGQRVAIRVPHRSLNVLEEADCIPIPDGCCLEDAVWFALAKIGLLGVVAAGHQIGDSVLVVGGGPIGQMALRWAICSGAANIGMITKDPTHLNAAKRVGIANLMPGRTADWSANAVWSSLGEAPQLVIDCTGSADVVAWCLRVAANLGRVVLIGDTGWPSQQRLTSDLIVRGIKLVGSHDIHQIGRWTDKTAAKFFFTMILQKRFHTAGLCTHSFSPREVAKAYQLLVSKENGLVGVRFEWRTA